MLDCAADTPRCLTSLTASTRRSRFAKDEIVAVVLALPEPFFVLALMNDGIEPGDRQNLIAANEASLVAEALKTGKYVLHIAGCEMPIFALENEQRRVVGAQSAPRP